MIFRTKIFLITLVCFLIVKNQVNSAMTIQGYDEKKHDRFYTGADRDFIGEAYDWSGVALETGNMGGYASWAVMITPCHFLTTYHVPVNAGDTFQFYHGNDPDGASEIGTVASAARVGTTDMVVGTLTADVSSNVAVYALPDPNWFTSSGQEQYVFGRDDNSPTDSMRVGRNIVDDIFTDVTDGSSTGDAIFMDYNTPGLGDDETYSASGDSGAPTFQIYNGTPMLTSIRWALATNPDTGLNSTVATYVPSYISEIQDIIDTSGCPHDLILIPEAKTYLLISTVMLLLLKRKSRNN